MLQFVFLAANISLLCWYLTFNSQHDVFDVTKRPFDGYCMQKACICLTSNGIYSWLFLIQKSINRSSCGTSAINERNVFKIYGLWFEPFRCWSNFNGLQKSHESISKSINQTFTLNKTKGLAHKRTFKLGAKIANELHLSVSRAMWTQFFSIESDFFLLMSNDHSCCWTGRWFHSRSKIGWQTTLIQLTKIQLIQIYGRKRNTQNKPKKKYYRIHFYEANIREHETECAIKT